jgi:cation diffusion facilitator family transporter
MTAAATPTFQALHSHVFLGEGHEINERKAWGVIILCGGMMLIEIVGGLFFGSIALVADGMHMSTHAGALLLAALAYSFSRKHMTDSRFTFGTGKLADLAGFSSALVLAMIALLIGYEAISRLFAPVPIHFAEAIPIACLGLAVNIASAWLLSRGHHDHGQVHEHEGDERPEEGAADQDNNMRAAVIHVVADATVSVFVIVGLTFARLFGWLWMDPLAGIVGACVIASWSYGLVRDTGAILLDMTPDAMLCRAFAKLSKPRVTGWQISIYGGSALVIWVQLFLSLPRRRVRRVSIATYLPSSRVIVSCDS